MLRSTCRDAGDSFLRKLMEDNNWQIHTEISQDCVDSFLCDAGVEFLQTWMGEDNLERWEDLWKRSGLANTVEFVSWVLDATQSVQEGKSVCQVAEDVIDEPEDLDLLEIKCEPPNDIENMPPQILHIESGETVYTPLAQAELDANGEENKVKLCSGNTVSGIAVPGAVLEDSHEKEGPERPDRESNIRRNLRRKVAQGKDLAPKLEIVENTEETTIIDLPPERNVKYKKKKYSTKETYDYRKTMLYCETCDYKTTNPSSISRHNRARHGAPKQAKKYGCDLCEYKSPYHRCVKSHKISRHGLACAATFSPTDYITPEYKAANPGLVEDLAILDEDSSDSMQIEETGTENLGDSDSDKESKRTTTKRLKNTKKQTVNAEGRDGIRNKKLKLYKCGKCDYKTTNPSSVSRHNRSRHGVPMKPKKYACDMCEYKSPYHRCIMSHKMSRHGAASVKNFNPADYIIDGMDSKKLYTRGKYACNLCDYRTSQRNEFKSHKMTHREETSMFDDYAEMYTPKEEGQEAVSEYGNEVNLKKEAPDFSNPVKMKIKTKYPCSICGKLYHNHYMGEHTRVMHSGEKIVREKKFLCNTCGYSTPYSAVLKSHMLTHGGEKNVLCHLCDFRTRYRSHLRKHLLRCHTESTPVACEECGKSFAARDNLLSHIRSIHRPPTKTYSCESCGRKFTNSKHLKRHAIVHTGEKPYACDLCDHRCSQPGNLRTHKRLVHKVFFN